MEMIFVWKIIVFKNYWKNFLEIFEIKRTQVNFVYVFWQTKSPKIRSIKPGLGSSLGHKSSQKQLVSNDLP